MRTLRRIIKDMNLDESRYSAKEAQWFINARKDDGLRPQHIDPRDDPTLERLAHIYQT